MQCSVAGEKQAAIAVARGLGGASRSDICLYLGRSLAVVVFIVCPAIHNDTAPLWRWHLVSRQGSSLQGLGKLL
jgi:hypothetical protein